MTMVMTAALDGKARSADATQLVRFDALDSWRGICALLVAAFHFPLAGTISQNALVRGSFLFVDFFFVLSGFVFMHAYGARLAKGEGFGRFVLTRFGRLAPLHLFMLAVLFALEVARHAIPQLGNGDSIFTGRNTLEALLPNILMVHSFGLLDQLTWNTPSWSISAEMFAYLLFGAALVWVEARAAQAALLIGLAALIALYTFSPLYIDATYDMGVIRCLFGFSAGVLAYLIYQKTRVFLGTENHDRLAWTIAEAAVIAGVIGFVSNFSIGAPNLLAPLVFVLAVLIFAQQGGWFSSLLQSKLLIYLGTISYSIYLTHLTIQAALYALARFAHNRFGWQDLIKLEKPGAREFAYGALENFGLVLLMLSLTVLVSSLTFRHIESPSRQWFRKLAAR